MSTNDLLRELIFDNVPPNHIDEVQWLKDYLKKDGAKEVIFASLGESWDQVPDDLMSGLSRTPAFASGYQISMWGLPRLRKALVSYFAEEGYVANDFLQGRDFELAITWTGTRDAMFDFGRYLQSQYFAKGEATLIATAPGWDYKGVFEPLGFRTKFVYLDKENGFAPSIADLESAMNSVPEGMGLIVLNVQHNPTSVNWSQEAVNCVLQKAKERSFALLIDDAHFGIRQQVEATHALNLMLSAGIGKFIPWLCVRSLGKQFGINGWSIGAMIGSHNVLDVLVNKYRAEHIYNYGGVEQYALADWLAKKGHVPYLSRRLHEIAENKKLLVNALVEKFGYPANHVFAGSCTNFLMFSLPPYYADMNKGVKLFVNHALEVLGVLLTDAWPKPYNTDDEKNFACLRAFVGMRQELIFEMVQRFESTNFAYGMDQPLSLR